ncbi:hypothetical protein ACH5RR_035720 [Cinchona calisaya]|uniref:At1g61320/AtMIF1 LRR domain-containing protein n=1 Tax=Cinchona calisaya TaxID=153742 RepID=A0ABD2Y2L8_9GENT
MLLYECTGERDVRVERRRYSNWVNQVLVSHQAPSIEQFRAYFELDKDHSTTIDSWTRFAAAKRVRRLELDLSSLFSSENVKELEEIYSFPMDQLLSGELNLKLLTSLRLIAINVVGGSGSGDLRLKHLEIMRCLELERLEVSGARSLASFKYEVWYADVEREGYMHFQDVPQLSSAYFGRAAYSHHLEFDEHQRRVLFVSLFLRASPCLHKLVLKYDPRKSQITCGYSTGMNVEFGEMQQRLVKGCKYECLKEVELLGWNGLAADVELSAHLIEAAGSLEKVTVDPRNPFPDKFLEEQVLSLPKVITAMEDARNRARDLEAKLSPATKLVVL